MSMRTLIRLLAACACVTGVAPLHAGEPPSKAAPTAEEAAEAARSAFTGKDQKALTEIATLIDPDAWIVADLLLSQGSPEVAKAVGARAPHVSRAPLLAYLSRRAVGPDELARKEALRDALETLRSGRNEEAVRLAAAFPPTPRDVPWIRVRHGLGSALEKVGKFPDAAKAFAEAADVAEPLGWIARAATLRFSSGRAAWKAKDAPTAERAWTAALALHEREGSLRGQATCLLNLGMVRFRRSDLEGARQMWTDAFAKGRSSKHAETIALASGNLANLLQALGEELAAVGVREANVEAWRAAENSVRLAQALAAMANLRATLGDGTGARAALAEADAVAEGVTDARARAEVGALGAKALRGLGDPDAALGRLDRVLESAAAMEDPRFLGNVRAYRAGALHDLDRAAEARTELESALPTLRTAGEGGDLCDALRNLAVIRLTLGDAAGARPPVEEAVSLAQSLHRRSLELRCLRTRANVMARQGEAEAAIRDLERGVLEHSAAGRDLEAAVNYEVLADVRARMGKTKEALADWEHAKDVYAARKALLALVRVWNWRGTFHDRQLETAAAVDAYQQAVEAARAATNGRELARSLLNLGSTQRDAGRRTAARRSLEEAVTSAHAAGSPSFEGSALAELALLEQYSLGPEGRTRLLERALALVEKGTDRAAEVSILTNLAPTLVQLGRAPEAVAHLDRARHLLDAQPDPDDLAWVELRLARVRLATGALDPAAQGAQEALRLWEGLKDAAGVDRASKTIGDVYLTRGELNAARAAYARIATTGSIRSARSGIAAVELRAGHPREAIAAARDAVRLFPTELAGMSDEETSEARSIGQGAMATGLDAAVALGDASEAWYFLEAGRAGALLMSLSAADAVRAQMSGGPARGALAAARAREGSAARAVREATMRSDPEAFERAQSDFAAAKEARRALLRDVEHDALLGTSPDAAAPASLAEVQAALRPDEALLLHERREQSLVTLVVRRAEARLVLSKRVPDAEVDVRGDTERLRDFLVAPLALPDDVRTLLISPCEQWSDLPYGLLWPGRDVALVPSGSVLLRLRRRGTPRGQDVLALGDPLYGAAPEGAPLARLRSEERLLPIPGTGIEAKAVARKPLLGIDATKDRLKKSLAEHRWRVLHFACHGLLNAQGVDRPGLALTAVGDDDGILTVDDVLEMGCPADLVVLSACRSARGRVAAREGLLGLPRAFLLAGANSVVASQAPVDDEKVLALMKDFHRRLAVGTGPARALREAQEAFAADATKGAPRLGADWVLWGLPE